MTNTLFAAPWWWTQFTVGDDNFNHSSNFERWMALYPYSAQSDEDVWLSSYTWGTGNNGPVNGFFGDNDLGGVNQVYLRRKNNSGAAPVRVIGDGDETEILDQAAKGLPIELSPPDSSMSFVGRSHQKTMMLGDRSLMVGSANMTAGAFSSQPNNMTVIRNFPSLNGVFRDELQEQFSGTHFDNSASTQNHFTSPAGNRVSVYFAPDDNFNISLPSGGSGLNISQVLERRVKEAEESVFYLSNNFYLPYLARDLKNAADNKLVEGVLDTVGDLESDLVSSHTARDANTYFDRQMHHKVMIFDQEIVTFGSANHTRSAMVRTMGDRNAEHLVEVHSFRMARRYMQEYRRVMSLLDEENKGQPDSFETSSPAAPTNFMVKDDPSRSGALNLTWSAPSAPGDFSRYYVFVADYELNSAKQIGDGVDNDDDGQVDEDPRGDADGFASGTSLNELHPDDDDADGRIDEDPWMYPEKQIKAEKPASITSTTLTTYNVGEPLPDNKNLWLGLVAVDKHGNESDPVFYGPVQSHAGEAAIQPAVDDFAFDADASAHAGDTSNLLLSISNSPGANEDIKSMTVKFDNGDSAFKPLANQTAPAGYTVSVDATSITFAATSNNGITPGSSREFNLAVENPQQSGCSREVLVDFEDESGNIISDISAGSLKIAPPSLQEELVSLSASAGGDTITVFDGSQKLAAPAYNFAVEVEELPDTGLVMYWDVENEPDGPGGSGTDNKVELTGDQIFTGTVSDTDEIMHGRKFKFIFYLDGQKIDREGKPFSFEIDREVSTPGISGVISRGSKTVKLGLETISDVDFKEYRVYYTTASSVDYESDYQTFYKRDDSAVTVDGLQPGETYLFAVSAVDFPGNESKLSSARQVTTREATTLEDISVFSSDLSRVATDLDGSEKFRVEPLTVQAELTSPPAGEVKIYYDVGDNPDGPGGFNTEERVSTANGSDTYWEAGIPGDDSEFSPGATLKFIVYAGDQFIDNNGQPFKLTFTENVPVVSDLDVVDTGGGAVTLNWEPVTNFSNFSQYQIFYSLASDSVDLNSSSWSVTDDPALTLNNTSQTTVNNLSPRKKYKFKVAILDSLGGYGRLSAPVEATTKAEGVLLFTEFSPHTSPRWVEVTARSKLDLRDYYLTDMDANTAAVVSETTILNEDERAVLWFTTGQSETDNSGDVNGDGIKDLYIPSASSFAFSDTVDQLVLVDQTGETVDALVYRQNPEVDFGGELTDVNSLTSVGHWNSSDSEGSINIYDTTTLSRPAFFWRKTEFGKLVDEQSRTDWSFSTKSSPGQSSDGIKLREISIKDRSTSPEHYFSVDATKLGGSESLKKSEYQLTAQFNENPLSDSGFFIWYDTDADPEGFSAPNSGESIPVTTGFDPGSNQLQTTFSLSEVKNNDRVKILLSLVPDPENPSELDEKVFDRSGAYYQFNVDTNGLSAPENFSMETPTRDGIIFSWQPLNKSNDFYSYRIYYDTGTVDYTSPFFNWQDIPELADYRIDQANIPLPVSADTWHLRIAAVDQVGNGNEMVNNKNYVDELSDTESVLRLPPIGIDDLTVKPGSLEKFDGSDSLPADKISFRFIFDRATDDPYLVWDKNNRGTLPDTGVTDDTALHLNKVKKGEYTTSIPPAKHGDLIQFIIKTDGGELNNDGSGYCYQVDGRATPPISNFSADTAQYTTWESATSDLLVRWKPLADNVKDFASYKIFYQKGDTVTLSSPSVGPEKYPTLSDKRVGSQIIKGVDRASTYTLAVAWRDQVGNLSLLSDSDTIQTVDAQPTEDPAYDGKFVAHELDGSEYLRKSDIRVTFEFSENPAYPEDVSLHYTFDGDPTDSGAKVLPMTRKSQKIYETVIPESESMTEGTAVNYVVKEGPWVISNNNGYFSFKIDQYPPPEIGNFRWDDGDWIGFNWSPLRDGNDFQEYVIRYRRPGESAWQQIDSTDYNALGDYRTGSLFVDQLSSDANYYLNITAVDKMGRVNYLPADLLLLRDPGNNTPQFVSAGRRFFVLNSGDTATLEAELTDIYGSSWYEKQVTFEIQVPGLEFAANSDTEIYGKTNQNGITRKIIKASADNSRYVPVKAKFSNDFFAEEIEYYIRILNSEETTKSPKLVPFEK